LNHQCDKDCKEYADKDCPYDKWIIGDLKFRRCPLRSITENNSYWIKAYNLYKNGFLPVEGGWLKQTNKFIEVMSFIETTLMEQEKQEAQKNGTR
jgi:hypothetical protein